MIRATIILLAIVCSITTANASLEAREARLIACEKYSHLATEYKHDQDIIKRCATYSTLIYAYESNYGRSTMCQTQNNCHGLKGMQNGAYGFLTFSSVQEGYEYFAEKYMTFHYNKNSTTLIQGYWIDGRYKFGWSTTDVDTYIQFINARYWDIYNSL